MRLYNHVPVYVNTSLPGESMIYTGHEKYTDDELVSIAYGTNSRLAIELAKRFRRQAATLRERTQPQRGAGAGVNPIPCPGGEEADEYETNAF